MRTLLLTERRPTTCTLSGDDVGYLLAEHGSHLRITPTRAAGVVELRPTRLVGVIVAPTCRLVIRPKLPLRSFVFLLDPEAAPIDRPATAIETTPEFDVHDFLTQRLLRLLAERLAAGLHRSYVEQTNDGPFLQGRLDVALQLREEPRRDRLHSRREDLSPDVPCNQVVRATLDLLERSPFLSGETRPAVQQGAGALAAITSTPLSQELFARVLGDASAMAYRPLLELCRLVFEGLQPAAGPGTPGLAFLLDLERLFERHVSRGVQGSFADSPFRVEEQLHLRVADSAVSLRPDLLIRAGEQTHLVVDAKWKRPRPETAYSRDLYQVLAYGSVLGARRLALVYPARQDACHGIRLPDDIEVRIYKLRMTAGAAACTRSLGQLSRALRRWLRPERESRL